MRDWSELDEHLLQHYRKDGYLHLTNVLTPQEVAFGLKIVDAVVDRDEVTVPMHGSFAPRSHTKRIRNAIAQDTRLGYFLEHPKVLGPLISILGLNLHVLGSEIFVRALSDVPLAYWHTDGGTSLQRTLLTPESQGLQLKVQIFLTDVQEDAAGNFLLLPGTQNRLPAETLASCTIEELNDPLDKGELPKGAKVIRAKPGDVIIFPYGLWHAVAPNRVRPRKTFIFRYGQLWHRPHDYLLQPEDVLSNCSTRLRRMLGNFEPQPHPTDFYKPQDQVAIMQMGGTGVYE